VLPLRDRNPTVRTPVITIALIVVNVAVFLLIQKGGTLGQQDDTTLTYEHAAIPCELTQGHPLTEREIVTDTCTERRSPEVFPDKSVLLSVFVSMFLHGGWLHLGGNMLFLWVFGNNVEDSMGPGRFLAFYLICGLVAAATQVLLNPTSAAPTVGASGAISGVLGAYLIMYPRVRVHMLFIFIIFFKVFRIPAWIVLLYWFGIQVATAYLTPLQPDVSSGVAVWAHIGGFISGMLLIKLFENPELVAERNRIRSEQQWTLRSA
jgi:membrane associated rhomboid family serine protease